MGKFIAGVATGAVIFGTIGYFKGVKHGLKSTQAINDLAEAFTNGFTEAVSESTKEHHDCDVVDTETVSN